MSARHFVFQCSHTYDESLASYNNGDATSEILEYVLFKGAHELLRKVMVLMMSGHSEFLQMAYETLQYIVDHCQEHLSENALVIEGKEQRKSIVPKNNHLQESQDKEEEHQEGEVDNEWHTTNTMLVYDAALFSDDSYYAQIDDNCSEEDLCLDSIFWEC